MKFYTGIGSRETPEDVLRLMKVFAAQNADRGWVLRSGHAAGADIAFESGLFESLAYYDGHAPLLGEIWLPWATFGPLGNEDPHERGKNAGQCIEYHEGPSQAAINLAAELHPAWDRLKQGARKLHARNVHQITGASVKNPLLSKFVLCWTKGARGQGGTGQAIRVAKHFGVPVFDLADPRVRARVEASLAR